MRSIAIAQITLVWLTTCSTYYVMAAPMQGIVEVPLKAGCPCGHDAEKIQPLVQNRAVPSAVAEERNVMESGCKGAHDHDDHHGPVISNRPTPPPSTEKPRTSGSCASGCDHHDSPVVIPGGPTPPISKEMPSTQGSCGSGCGHDHGPTPVLANKPSTPPPKKEKPATSNSSCKSGCHGHDHAGGSDPHSHGKSSGAPQSTKLSEASHAGGCDHDHHHGPSEEDWKKTVEYRVAISIRNWFRKARNTVGRWLSRLKAWATRQKPKKD
ncbi:hypothetical protein PGT21_015332 [Puccinia graminis f. sp. tritici]|nr:hypothetical protein PGT21_015332 [Puccinia graminis f. sp. tritici]